MPDWYLMAATGIIIWAYDLPIPLGIRGRNFSGSNLIAITEIDPQENSGTLCPGAITGKWRFFHVDAVR
ncbi:MAG: hypothetical protein ABR999_06145 [Methanoregula sp.]|jgi:hypothetical protein|uniref:hypothetical protein n=1 Tax=Methanoregula sp. TaxID=2052170 RepID=UPI003D0E5E22